MEEFARLRRALTYARRTTVVLTTLVATVLAIQVPANAASPQPVSRTLVGQTATGTSLRTGTVASVTSPGCQLTVGNPDVADNGGATLYVWGGGTIRCIKPVAYIEVVVNAYHNNSLYGTSTGSASTRPGFKLYSVLQIYAPACQPGSWYFEVSGYVIGLPGMSPYIGFSGTSAVVNANC